MGHLSSSFRLPCNEQPNCCLFQKLPGEVRDRIYAFALSSYDDPNQLYEQNTPYWRPDCVAPPKVDFALLQTCQRIYTEAWFYPWASTTHKFWLTSHSRRPGRWDTLTPGTFEPVLQRVYDSHGQVNINEIQVFPQLCELEACAALTEILSMQHFHPLSFTITIRHHDWWWWENDERLRIDARWVNECRFPDSLKNINLELESLQRKKDQIDWIAEMMRTTWQFQSASGTIFSAAKCNLQVTQWTGSSIWENERWIRDETKPEKVDYYIKTVTWKPRKSLSANKIPAQALAVPDRFKVMDASTPALSIYTLRCAGVRPGTNANEAKRLVEEYQTNNPYDSDTSHGDNWGDDEYPIDDSDFDDFDDDFRQEILYYPVWEY